MPSPKSRPEKVLNEGFACLQGLDIKIDKTPL